MTDLKACALWEDRVRPCVSEASVLVVLLFLAASAAAEPPANGRFANSGYNGKVCANQPQPGLVIDKSNVGNYGCFLPEAAIEVVKHGFKIRIAKVHELDWPNGYKQATEKYG